MLVPVSQSGLSDMDKFGAILHHRMMAVDLDSGAYLMASHGLSKWAPKYFLILPHETPAQRGGFLGERKDTFGFERAVIRAWSENEAIDAANQRLPKLIKRAARSAHEAQR